MKTSKQITVLNEPVKFTKSDVRKFSLFRSNPSSFALLFVSFIIASEISLKWIDLAPNFASGILKLPTPQPASQKLLSLILSYSFNQLMTSSTVFWWPILIFFWTLFTSSLSLYIRFHLSNPVALKYSVTSAFYLFSIWGVI